MARACGPTSGPQMACRGLGAHLRGQVRLGNEWPWPLLPPASCLSLSLAGAPRPYRSIRARAGWEVLIKGGPGEEEEVLGLVREMGMPRRARAGESGGPVGRVMGQEGFVLLLLASHQVCQESGWILPP